MTPETEQFIINFFGPLLCIGFTIFLYLVDRARSRQPVEAEPEETEEGNDDQFTYRTDPELGAVPGAWARGRE